MIAVYCSGFALRVLNKVSALCFAFESRPYRQFKTTKPLKCVAFVFCLCGIMRVLIAAYPKKLGRQQRNKRAKPNLLKPRKSSQRMIQTKNLRYYFLISETFFAKLAFNCNILRNFVMNNLSLIKRMQSVKRVVVRRAFGNRVILQIFQNR